MTMLKWATPFDEIDLLRQDFDALFQKPKSCENADFNVPVQVVELENGYRVAFSLPGLPSESVGEHVQIEATAKTLTLSGALSDGDLQPTEKRLINQFRTGKFYKQLSFPDGINPDTIEARYQQGILTIQLEKAHVAQKRTIAIQT
jgi:HSP20 family protein